MRSTDGPPERRAHPRHARTLSSLALALAMAAGVVAGASDGQLPERTNPEGLSRPQTYSHVVRVGKLMFIAGQVGADAEGRLVGPGMREQLEQVLKNLQVALGSHGADFSHLAKITIFVTSIDEFRSPDVAEVRAKYFGAHKPASTLVQVDRLANPTYKVEIEAVAALP